MLQISKYKTYDHLPLPDVAHKINSLLPFQLTKTYTFTHFQGFKPKNQKNGAFTTDPAKLIIHIHLYETKIALG